MLKYTPLPDEVCDVLADETRGYYLVGMAPTEFLKTFLPWNKNTPSCYQQQIPHITRENSLKSVSLRIGQGNLELSTYKKYVEALDGWVTGMDNGQQLRFAHFAKPDVECASLNVDVATYWQSDFPSDPSHASCKFSLQQTHEKFMPDHTYDAFCHDSDEGPETQYPTEPNAANQFDPMTAVTVQKDSEEAGKIDIAVDIVINKDAGSVCPDKCYGITSEEGIEHASLKELHQNFKEEGVASSPLENIANGSREDTDPVPLVSEVEKDTQNGIRTRGQIAAYAGIAMSMAFRSHFFSVLILGEFARFIRWDRRGAIVSRRFNYVRRPNLIFGFYLRFGQLSPRQRGFDTNAVRVPSRTLPDDVARAFDKYYEQSWHEGAKFSHHKLDGRPQMPAKESSFYRVTVNDSTSNQTDAFFVPAPAYRPNILNPFTRGSRRSLAFLDSPDEKERTMCFMKDSWQEGSAHTEPEANIYRRLHEHGVPNIASMRLGDDVADMKTETQEWRAHLNHSVKFKHFGPLVCHRLVLNTVARDISTFTWCKVLLSCLADVVDAAQAAFKAGVLHRDISAGNIMIVHNKQTNEWRGILIDWDMCLLLDERHKHQQMRTGRTGTWAFISARLLQPYPSEPVVHSLGDDMESIFWVLVYQVLRYTHHEDGPYQLYQRMHRLFNDAVTDNNNKVVGGFQKVGALSVCGHGHIDVAFGTFNVTELHDVFSILGERFYARYRPRSSKSKIHDVLKIQSTIAPAPTVDWDSPEEKWFSTFLRQVAELMDPLGITPTALESPTNDSKPPPTPALFKPAKIGLYPPDYYEMPWSKEENDYKKVNESAFSKAVTSSQLNHMDGLSAGASKRPLEVDDDGNDNEGLVSGGGPMTRATKRQRAL